MLSSVLPLDTDAASLALVGGKGANLARLVRAAFPVPPGFIVTTDGYDSFVSANNLLPFIAATLAQTATSDLDALERASAAIRGRFAAGQVPEEIVEQVRAAYTMLGSPPVAVRSSATAEDLPDMSFAGQQDTFLNIVDEAALLAAVVRCWSSLWTARAIGYRARNAIPHDGVSLAVVVQQLVPSEASGVLFTANPLSGKRDEIVIDATLGLGEALVSGQVEPDHYVVDPARGHILSKSLGAKAVVTRGQPGGGIVTVSEEASSRQALPDDAILALARLGQRVAKLFGTPQDIEWGWADRTLFLLQSRPITSLFPAPRDVPPEPLRLYLSFGAVQGMLDPMTPLGQDTIVASFVAAARTLMRTRVTLESQTLFARAGERLWIDLSGALRNPLGRRLLRRVLPVVEPSTAQVIERLVEEPRLTPRAGLPSLRTGRNLAGLVAPMLARLVRGLVAPDASRVAVQQRVEALVRDFTERGRRANSLGERLALYDALLATGFSFIFPQIMPRIMAGMIPLALLGRLTRTLDGPSALELTRGLPHNVTTEMDLALWACARAIQQDPSAAVAFAGQDATALAAAYRAGTLPPVARQQIDYFMQRYGMRGLAEIDLGRPRWREEPMLVFQSLRSYLQIDALDQAPDALFARGAMAAEASVEQLVEAVGRTRGGLLKAGLVRFAARRVRALAGLRESPKFTIIRLFGIVREALLASGHDLVRAGVLDRPDDLFFLYRSELGALATGEAGPWKVLVAERRLRYERERQRRQVPRVLLSDGQAFYEGLAAPDGMEAGAIVGSPVSAGVVEGKVHVVLEPHGVQLLPGEILVCLGTDPAWTPLFLSAGGLIMEVGGLMTHGSVVAREYGIPAVVGVHGATRRLQTGQRVRVDGGTGRIVVLEESLGS